jgi:hypothetical protein
MPNIADLFELSMQATIDCVQRVASGGAEMLAVLLKKNVGDAYARPLDEEHARLNSVSFEQWKFPPISDALRSSLPASLVSLVKQVGNPVGNGQCMPLSLMMQSTGCGEKDNDAAKLLRALAVFELIEHVEFYLGLGGVEFVRDVFVSLVGKGRNGQYGYAWPEHNTMFVFANVLQRAIVVVEQRHSGGRRHANDDERHGEPDAVFLPLRFNATTPLSIRSPALFVIHCNDAGSQHVADHFRPLALNDVDGKLMLLFHARHMSKQVDELTRPFVDKGWCLARGVEFDDLILSVDPLGMVACVCVFSLFTHMQIKSRVTNSCTLANCNNCYLVAHCKSIVSICCHV